MHLFTASSLLLPLALAFGLGGSSSAPAAVLAPAAAQVPMGSASVTELPGDVALRLSAVRRAAELRLQGTDRLTSERRTSVRAPVAATSVFDNYTELQAWFDELATYLPAYSDLVEAQALEVTHAHLPYFAAAEEARAAVFESMGEEYILTQSWLHSMADGDGDYSVAHSNGGASAAIDELILLPFSVPGLELSDLPPFVAQVLGPYNAPVLHGYFYSARLDGQLRHAGLAVETTHLGDDYLLFLPDTVPGPEAFFTAEDVTILRHLDHTGGGLDWTAILDAIRPPFSPPTWTPDFGGDGMLRTRSVPCEDVGLCILGHYNTLNQELAAAQQVYNESVRQAKLDYEQDKKVIQDSMRGMGICFSMAGFFFPIIMDPAWLEYFNGLLKQNEDQLKEELQEAKDFLKTSRCAAFHKFRNKAAECLEDCPGIGLAAGRVRPGDRQHGLLTGPPAGPATSAGPPPAGWRR